MSIGYLGLCKKYIEDDNYVIYIDENLNREYRGDLHLQDGIIYIDKKDLPKPTVKTETVKKSSGRKQTIKKIIPVSCNLDELLDNGKIKIEPIITDFKN